MMQSIERAHHLQAVFPPNHILNPIGGKCQTKPNQRTFYFKTWVLIKNVRPWKTKLAKMSQIEETRMLNNTETWYSIYDPEALK